MRASNKLSLGSTNVTISKQNFLEKIEEIPLFSNLIRVETFFQDRKQALIQKSMMQDINLNVTFTTGSTQFSFKFNRNQLGDALQAISDSNVDVYEYSTGMIVSVELARLYFEDTIIDVKEKIYETLIQIAQVGKQMEDAKKAGGDNNQFRNHQKAFKIYKEYQELMRKNKGKDFINEVIGTRDFFVLSQDLSGMNTQGQTQWNLIQNQFQRISSFDQDVNFDSTILLKLGSPRMRLIMNLINMRDDDSSFECRSIYKHADMSYEWRKCRIIRREPKDRFGNMENSPIEQEAFVYWIEFFHLRHYGSSMWCKRQAKQILFSASYQRNFQRSFHQNILKFISRTYPKSHENSTHITKVQK